MGLGWIILLGVVLLILVIGLFSMMSDPNSIDAEESAHIVREQKARSKKRWWQR
jgi:hypothetical protein